MTGRNQWGAPRDADDRFLSKVTIVGDCWQWNAGISDSGYPTFNPSPGVKVYAARWLLERLGRKPPRRARLTWLCGNVQCVRPAHLSTDVFWNQVQAADADACWVWRGFLHRGYGRFNHVLAHRFAYEQLRGEIPAGLGLDHLCETSACVNPWHLEPVPQTENSRRKSPEYRERVNATIPTPQKAA
jgi:hypothetical protein